MRIILLIVSLFITGFSFCQIHNLNGGGLDPISELTVTDTLTVEGVFKYSPPHGAFTFHDSTTSPDATQNNWERVTNAWDELFVSVETTDITFGGDSVTIIHPGDYVSIISFSFSGSAADSWEFSMFKNGVKTGVTIDRTTSQTDVGNISIPVYVEDLATGDGITFQVRNIASNDDPTFVSCSWLIWLLHPEL